MVRPFLISLFFFIFAGVAQAHEIRPAYLQIKETTPSGFDVIWKQPLLEDKRLKIVPLFPDDCEETTKRTLESYGDTVIERWGIKCALDNGEIKLEGLDLTLTDVFVDITYLENEAIKTVLKPDQLALNLASAPGFNVGAYLEIGVWHVLKGWDHLLFVLGLVLLVRPKQVIGVATSFTVAHSLTLAITALGFLTVPSRPVEILIAASIVFLAMEVIQKHRGKISIASKKPWIVAFCIGLIHGFGFAGALADIGLPTGQELLSLLLFNIGVELGQILVIIMALIVLWILAQNAKSFKPKAEIFATYIIGSIGMFWVIDRILPYFTA